MLKINFNIAPGGPLRILCLGAHPDDIEIGCGGTILRLIAENPEAEIFWIVFGSQGRRTEEACASAEAFLGPLQQKKVAVKDFRDGFFPYIGTEIKEYFEAVKQEISPDLILTHCRNDLHQDHRLINELTWNTFRDHLILEYEVPKYDGDLGAPNFYVHLDESVCQRKIGYIFQHYESQREKYWFTKDALLSILRLRGMESRAPDGYAEGFYCRKMAF